MLPFYVGYGKNNRYLDHLNEARKSGDPKSNKLKVYSIRKILEIGLTPVIKFVDSNLSKEQATELEVFLITMIGRRNMKLGPLTNMTDGGDGNRGWTEEQREEARERNKLLGLSPPDMTGVTYSKSPEMSYLPAIIKNTGERVQVSAADPRWETKELVGINSGITFSDEWLRKNSEGVSKLKWWNNGKKCVRTIECPGPEYIRGRGKIKW
jgi:hypothetical protein